VSYSTACVLQEAAKSAGDDNDLVSLCFTDNILLNWQTLAARMTSNSEFFFKFLKIQKPQKP